MHSLVILCKPLAHAFVCMLVFSVSLSTLISNHCYGYSCFKVSRKVKSQWTLIFDRLQRFYLLYHLVLFTAFCFSVCYDTVDTIVKDMLQWPHRIVVPIGGIPVDLRYSLVFCLFFVHKYSACHCQSFLFLLF